MISITNAMQLGLKGPSVPTALQSWWALCLKKWISQCYGIGCFFVYLVASSFFVLFGALTKNLTILHRKKIHIVFMKMWDTNTTTPPPQPCEGLQDVQQRTWKHGSPQSQVDLGLGEGQASAGNSGHCTADGEKGPHRGRTKERDTLKTGHTSMPGNDWGRTRLTRKKVTAPTPLPKINCPLQPKPYKRLY